LFAHLLRLRIEQYYEVLTNLPVGDLPRESDITVVRRTAAPAGAFVGIWQYLTTWNVQEFKGPTVSARVGDIDLLVEVGLGIDRRLNEERRKAGEAEVEREEVSFWYLANYLGRRFLRDARALLGGLDEVAPGIWRTRILGRWLVLVSNRELPVDRDSIPIHLLATESVDTGRAVAQTLSLQPDLWPMYSNWVATLFPELWEEMESMAKQKVRGPTLDLRPVIEIIGLGTVIKQVGIDRVIEQVGIDRVIEHLGADRVIEHLGPARVLKHLSVDTLLANLSPARRRELGRRLEQERENPRNGGTSDTGSK
jgi:hypothetical protein